MKEKECICHASWSGYNEQEWMARGCPKCECWKVDAYDKVCAERDELRAKDLCSCDEINSRHCQYHQELADLQKENEKLKFEQQSYYMTFRKGFDVELKERDKQITSLRASLKLAVEALESVNKKVGSCPFSNADKWGDVMESIYGVTSNALANIKAKHGGLK